MTKRKKTIKKTRKKISHFKKSHCSPKNKNSNVTCLDSELLLKISNILNLHTSINLTERNTNVLHGQISDKISKISNCDSEKCWSSIHEIINNLSQEDLQKFKLSFKPSMPSKWKENPTTWLTTSDIEICLKQYEDKYKNFKCYGALPMDFDLERKNQCVSGDLCKINIKQHLDEGKYNIGSVFNLDDHDEPGSHWVSLYMDLNSNNRETPSIYFFDSIADKPPKEIYSFVDDIKKQYKDIKNNDLEFLYNDIQHQKKNTECGIYSIHFITTMLQGKDFNEYINEIKDDQFMNKFRQFYFI